MNVKIYVRIDLVCKIYALKIAPLSAFAVHKPPQLEGAIKKFNQHLSHISSEYIYFI